MKRVPESTVRRSDLVKTLCVYPLTVLALPSRPSAPIHLCYPRSNWLDAPTGKFLPLRHCPPARRVMVLVLRIGMNTIQSETFSSFGICTGSSEFRSCDSKEMQDPQTSVRAGVDGDLDITRHCRSRTCDRGDGRANLQAPPNCRLPRLRTPSAASRECRPNGGAAAPQLRSAQWRGPTASVELSSIS